MPWKASGLSLRSANLPGRTNRKTGEALQVPPPNVSSLWLVTQKRFSPADLLPLKLFHFIDYNENSFLGIGMQENYSLLLHGLKGTRLMHRMLLRY